MKKTIKNIRIIISWLLIGLYAAIYAGWDMVHAHVHQEIAVSHSPQIEKDSCHRSIFHGEQDTHKSHISSFKFCASCHTVSQPPAIASVPETIIKYAQGVPNAAHYCFDIEQQEASLFSSRAPPAIV